MAGFHNPFDTLGLAWAAAPVVISNNTAMVSAIFDLQGMENITFVVATGTLADNDATFTFLVEHDDVVGFGTAAAAPDECLTPLEAAASFDQDLDDGVRYITYTPDRGAGKQFVRCTLTPAGNAAAAPLAMIAVTKPYSYGA